MPILTIQHVTSYHYRHPVAFGEHRMMLRPRDDGDQRVLVSNINITPRPSEVSWTRDCFGNHIAIARFERRAEELRFESLIRVDHAPVQFRDRDVAERARTYPFAYTAEDEGDLARFVEQKPQGRRLDHWAQRFLRAEGATGTHAL